MSISLNTTLKSAQDSQSHHMIAEIKSLPMVADIPFVGEYLTVETTNEQKSNVITHSTGRLCVVYPFGTTYLKFVYTDTDRQEFNFVSISRTDLGLTAWDTFIEASLCELTDGNIGLIYTAQSSTTIYLKYAILSSLGVVSSYATIASYAKTAISNIVSPSVITLQNDTYFLAYSKGISLSPTSSGTYTGTTDGQYECTITQSGTETTAKFKWRKDDGGWSSEITCTGAAQLLAEGVSIAYVAGNYVAGMRFRIPVTAARTARGYISITNNPNAGDTITIGATVYTYQTYPLGGGGNPYDVAIDLLGKAISLENLECAITKGTYEGTGEGVRYGTGTVAHVSVTALRNEYTLTVTALTAGAAGNSITLSKSVGAPFTILAMSGGANSIIGSVVTDTSSTLKKRTSSNFTSWSAESDITIANIEANEKEHVNIYQIDTGDIWICFDNADDWSYSNAYYSVSADNGATWGNAAALTSYASALASGLHPVIVQKSATQIYAIYHEQFGALHIDSDSVGWPGGISSITGIHVYNGKVYALATYTSFGTKYFIAVIEVNITTWRITNSWNTTSIPAFHTVFANISCWWRKNRSAGKYVVISTDGYSAVNVLDVDGGTIKEYYFYDWSAYAIIKSVDYTAMDAATGITATFIDADNDRLYVVLTYANIHKRDIDIGYIDLTEELAPGSLYTFTRVYYSQNLVSETAMVGLQGGDFKVFPSENKAVLSSYSGWYGPTLIFTTSDTAWTVSKHYVYPTYPTFPANGLISVEYENGILYGIYVPHALQSSSKGFCKIDIATDTVTYIEPVWPVQYNDYKLWELCWTDDNMLIISSYAYGITIYDPATGQWTLYNNDNVTGLTPDDDDTFMPVAYDSSTGIIFTGAYEDDFWCGLVGFSRYGLLKQPKYRIGTYIVSWSFAAASNFITGYADYDAVACLDPVDNGIYAFWTKQNMVDNELSIKWAKETPEFDLTPYLTRRTPIVISRSIENRPNTVSFEVSHGHLFDPFNEQSLFRNYVAKGHKLVIRYGERVSGVDYWQNVGSFIITERSMITYERGSYPCMGIKGEDKRTLWQENEILVSTNYEGKTPEYILGHILENEAEEDVGDINVPSFDTSISLYHQWLDTTVGEIIEQICNRFGYFPKIDVDDVFTCGKISDENDTDHTYSNSNHIISYSPDDTFSDYTNKIIVVCEGRTFYKHIFPRERIKFVTGTIGWWGQKQERQEWYSEDKTKQVENVKLKKLENPDNIMFQLSGAVHSEISEEDTDLKYCIVKIEAPDLRPALLAAISAYITGSYFSSTFWGEGAKSAALVTICYILASITNYQFEIWGEPVGYIRQSWQATAEDTDLQALSGKTIEKKIEEPLGYYINDAQTVADHEMMILRLQRNRIKIKKVGHLQDEEGDTIQINHPYTGTAMEIFITNITRTLKLPETPDSNDGYFTDDIEGWKL